MFSAERCKEIYDYAFQHSVEEAARHFEIKEESIARAIRQHKNPSQVSTSKILLFDIETLPLLGYVWSPWKQNLSGVQVVKDWCMLSWAAKWLYSDTIENDVLTPAEAKKRNDRRISKSLWSLFDEADIIIAHNLKKFDRKRSNTRFILNGLQPPSPYQIVDTLEQARRHFAFSFNRLDYLGQLINNKRKMATDFDLWKRCDKGDAEALEYMDKYCKKDVLLLEEVYLFLRPWIKSHPNVGIYSDAGRSVCSSCGSDKLKAEGHYVTPAGKFQSYRCSDCGAWSRERKSDLTKEQREQLFVSVAR